MEFNKTYNLIFLWEQFKEESLKAANKSKTENKPYYLVYSTLLKQFNATDFLHKDDEIITTYGGDDIYNRQEIILHDMVNDFSIWCKNHHEI